MINTQPDFLKETPVGSKVFVEKHGHVFIGVVRGRNIANVMIEVNNAYNAVVRIDDGVILTPSGGGQVYQYNHSNAAYAYHQNRRDLLRTLDWNSVPTSKINQIFRILDPS